MTNQKIWILGAFLAAAMALTGCASVPLDTPKTQSFALPETERTSLARSSINWRSSNPELNGFYPLLKGFDAFGARLKLMDRAERSIDVQYFLMKPDEAGIVFAGKLMEAADRGVRVRFLLDDIFTTVKDRGLILLNEHPNIELRIFNPIAREGIDALNYIGHFKTTNRRMHNKSFTVDNQAAIVGGRNIANEYFQMDTSGEFFDFDMLCAGPIVSDISASFDTYWNHKLAVPMDAFYDEADTKALDELKNEVMAEMQKTGESIYAAAINTELMQKFFAAELKPYTADARVIIDDPQKLLEKVSDDHKIVATELAAMFEEAQQEIVILTPYFIPGESGIELIRRLSSRGVRIVLVTNSLATNNHTSVHSAYMSHRKTVLEAGAQLWEVRADAAAKKMADGTIQGEQLTLHTKLIFIDRRYTFVGSLNLDPRSIDINTEMGVMIDSPDLAGLLTDLALQRVPAMAYKLELDENGKITWHATIDGEKVKETKEPQTSAWRRFKAWFLKIAPEKQL